MIDVGSTGQKMGKRPDVYSVICTDCPTEKDYLSICLSVYLYVYRQKTRFKYYFASALAQSFGFVNKAHLNV